MSLSPDALKTAGLEVQDSCRKLAPLVVRAVYETEPLTASGAWRPWGVQVSTSFSKAKALAQFGRLKRQYTSLLGAREPFVLPERNLSRGRRSLYMVQIGSDSRDDAAKLCASLRSAGGACIVNLVAARILQRHSAESLNPLSAPFGTTVLTPKPISQKRPP